MKTVHISENVTHVVVAGRTWTVAEVTRALTPAGPPEPAPTAKRSHPWATDERLVAAVRWDYEVALFKAADVVRKYLHLSSRKTLYKILNREVHAHVNGAQFPLSVLTKQLEKQNVAN